MKIGSAFLVLSLSLFACVRENRVTEDNDAPADATLVADGSHGDVDGLADGDDATTVIDTGLNDDPDQETDASLPNPTQRGLGCQSYCDRVRSCVFPVCSALSSVFTEMTCDEWCGEIPDFRLAAFAERSCDTFNEGLFQAAPQLERFCSDDPIPEACEEICGDVIDCGADLENDTCLRLCRNYEPEKRECAQNASGCVELGQCIAENNPQNELDYEEICNAKCFREVECVQSVCAAGTLDVDEAFTNGSFDTCVADCIDVQPPVEELGLIFGGLCTDIVANLRTENSIIDQRCDNTQDQVCDLLCDKAASCDGSVSRAQCLEECPLWDAANRICINDTPRGECERLNQCYGNGEDQARCRSVCDHLQACLLEACPPQIISPTFTDDCTANCLYEPPPQQPVEEYLVTECRQVRETVYRDNPALRPVCDGGQDFRPTAAECTDVCVTSLDECIVGGQEQCVGLCRTLTRDQYTCAIENGATCESIDACLN